MKMGMNVKKYLMIHPEKEDWYKQRFPEMFFSNLEEALEYNSQRLAAAAIAQREQQEAEKQLEEKIAACVESALEQLLKDLH